jgi:hypothetical protein
MLWIAHPGSNMGTWMQTVAAQWLLVSQAHASDLVSLVQTASLMPVLFLSLHAGVLAIMLYAITRPPTWKLNVADLTAKHFGARHTIESAIERLISYGRVPTSFVGSVEPHQSYRKRGRQIGKATRTPSSAPTRRSEPVSYSHSIVPGGLLVMSSTTRFTSRTSFVMRVEIFANTSYGTRDQSAVIASSLDTGRSTTGCP